MPRRELRRQLVHRDLYARNDGSERVVDFDKAEIAVAVERSIVEQLVVQKKREVETAVECFDMSSFAFADRVEDIGEGATEWRGRDELAREDVDLACA